MPHEQGFGLIRSMMAQQEMEDARVATGKGQSLIAGAARTVRDARARCEIRQRENTVCDAKTTQCGRRHLGFIAGTRPQSVVDDESPQLPALSSDPGLRQKGQGQAIGPS